MIRLLKPKTILEIGSGHSSKLAVLALDRNNAETRECGQHGRLICVEPYRHLDWFLSLGAKHIEAPIEQVDRSVFETLRAGDILFIDSSHMVRPQGDVLYLIQEILPSLPAEVYVHVHDIFTPFDYPNEWLVDRMHFWNEQYVLEAFLAFNPNFEIVASIQYLLHQDCRRLESLLPTLHKRANDIATTSIWLKTLKRSDPG